MTIEPPKGPTEAHANKTPTLALPRKRGRELAGAVRKAVS